ncbi:sporulation protein YqfC [Texcoconibacillus texcoconensis]|uniref:Sporulation protein YqfC n=2 Tax=Texcoconibacillus texcoconensis TaxID=1095777 RepID=A0A840QRG6_9BACI|nr:sporulation protein YqfC [Texcoconibacillus texcoconensis]MBB5173940.1 sporulation protein YqfC [Texcoconibacillus texcoconensis]
MKRFRKWIEQWMGEQFDLPSDIMMDLPRVTMIGNLHIYIENHRGLVRFTNEEVILRFKGGWLYVRGSDFVIKMILPEEILIEGTIHDVVYDIND